MTTNTDKPFEKRPGQGSAFKNNNKDEDWQADYKGEIRLPDGTMHYIDVQPGKTKAGEWWFKLKIGKVKPETNQQPKQGMVLDQPFAQPVAAPVPMLVSNDDDIPF